MEKITVDFSKDTLRSMDYVQLSENEASIRFIGRENKVEMILNAKQFENLKDLIREKEIDPREDKGMEGKPENGRYAIQLKKKDHVCHYNFKTGKFDQEEVGLNHLLPTKSMAKEWIARLREKSDITLLCKAVLFKVSAKGLQFEIERIRKEKPSSHD